MSRAGDLRNITATGTSSENDYVLTYDDTTKKVSLEVAQGGDVVNDTTPQLGGDLDVNGNSIVSTSSGEIDITSDGVLDLNANNGNVDITSVGGNVTLAGDTGNMIFTNTGTGTFVFGSSTADTTISGGTPALQVIGAGFNGYMAAVRRDTSQYASGIALVKSRNTSVGSYSALQDNDGIGGILFIGDDGTDLDTYGATITAVVNGTPSNNNMPADLEFATNSGTSSPTLNMKLTKDGVLEGASNAEIKTSPIRIHSNTISTNTTVASTENAVSGGPVTIANGVTVTVSGDWTVV